MRPCARRIAVTTLIVFACVAVTVLFLQRFKKSTEPPLPEQLRCVLDIRRHNDTTAILLCGYNYELLRRCGSDLGIGMEICAARRDDDCLDSLRSGPVQMVVAGWPMDTVPDSLLVSTPVDSMTVWVMPPGHRHTLRAVNSWIEHYNHSPLRDSLHECFKGTFNDPFKAAARGRHRTRLSPYDSLLRVYSADIGWDWRLLAALVWQESRFRIDLQSPKGAEGLMQMTPQTAGRYEMQDLLDPQTNIETGVRHIARMQRLFRRRVSSGDELRKVAMAAYNAGEGHIRDCFYYADWKGANDSTWTGLCAVMPALADSSILAVDTVKCGPFKVDETIRYVDGIMALYDAFCTICP